MRLRGITFRTIAALAILGQSLPALAEKVGVAAAVNPDAFSSLSGAPKNQLNIGKSIFYNERINTTSSGLVQVLLVDGSTFTVGPGSDLVIDRFVYDPSKGTGQISASFSKGVMRFVGGKISKNADGVTINTPAGVLGIRGGIVQGNGKIWSFLYGVSMSLGKYTVFEKGYTLDLTGSTPKIRPTTAADINVIMAGLTNSNAVQIGVAGDVGNPPPKQVLAETISLQDLIVDATATQIRDTLRTEEDTLAETETTPPDSTPPDTTPPNTTPPDTTPPDTTPPNTTPPDTTPPDTTSPDTTTPDTTTPDTTDNTPNPGGYAAGVVVSEQPQNNFKNVVAGNSPEDFLPGGDSASTMVLHDIQDGDPATSRYQLSFGSNPAVSVFNQNGDAYTQSSSTGQTLVAGPYPSPCHDCSFLEWGTFTTEVAFSDGPESTQYIDKINGWWVSGDLASPTEIDKLAALGATASYNGQVMGAVIRGNEGLTYGAAGDLWMGWDFAKRSGELEISNFDNRSFGTGAGGLTQVPGPNQSSFINQFSGTFTGEGLTGGATGSFVRGPDGPAQGVIGNWNVQGSGYRATGVFKGTQVPATH